MKRMIPANVLFLVSLTGSAVAVADCSSPVVQNLSNLLPGNTACVSDGGGWKAQEYHAGSSGQDNNLIDWHHGRRDPSKGKKELPNTDPTDPVGKWSITKGPPDRITYNYLQGASYTYFVHRNTGAGADTYSFCIGSTEHAVATIKTGQGACP